MNARETCEMMDTMRKYEDFMNQVIGHPEYRLKVIVECKKSGYPVHLHCADRSYGHDFAAGASSNMYDFTPEHLKKDRMQEKKEWLESIGAREFAHPMKWHDPNGILFSDEYLKNTPLDQIRAGYESIPKRMG